MAKTLFSTGVRVTSAFLNSIFGTSGGHRHDGADDDGHCDRINLATDVTGVLPFSAVGSHSHDGIQASAIDLTSDVTGVLDIVNQWQTISTFDVEFLGFDTPLNVVCVGFVSDLSAVGWGLLRISKLLFMGRTGNSAATGMYAPTGGIPADFCPIAGDLAVPTIVIDNNYFYPGVIRITNDGYAQVWKNPLPPDHFGATSGDFQTSGIKGFCDCGYTVIRSM